MTFLALCGVGSGTPPDGSQPIRVTSTASSLVADIKAAAPGTLITVPVAGGPVNISLANFPKDEPGVFVVLPSDQIYMLKMTGTTSGMHFFGGYISADKVLGTINSANYGSQFAAGTSRFSLNGVLIGQSAIGINAVNSTDIAVNNCLYNLPRNDCNQFVTVGRFLMRGCAGSEVVKGNKFCKFGDGRSPIEGIGSADCTGQGGIWHDTSHNDVLQARIGAYDFTLDSNSFLFQGAGFDNFGDLDTDGHGATRWLVTTNHIRASDPTGISIVGNDIDVRFNVVEPNPDAPGGYAAQLAVAPDDSTAADTMRVQGFGNAAGSISQPATVDLAGTTLNGTGNVIPPEQPRFNWPSWAPAIPALPDAPDISNVPPTAIPGPQFTGMDVPTNLTGTALTAWLAAWRPAVGVWLTIDRLGWANAAGATYEYKTSRDGTDIPGATSPVYQIMDADSGGSHALVGLVRGSVAGRPTSDWFPTNTITPA